MNPPLRPVDCKCGAAYSFHGGVTVQQSGRLVWVQCDSCGRTTEARFVDRDARETVREAVTEWNNK